MRNIPTVSIIQVLGVIGLAVATTAAVPTCSKSDSTSASTPHAANESSAATRAALAGPGLPADFPLAPGLSPCKPLDASGEIICEWHNVDGNAIYKFYLEALPKAGYSLHPYAPKVLPSDYHGILGMGFMKGSAEGAMTITNGKLTIQYLPHH